MNNLLLAYDLNNFCVNTSNVMKLIGGIVFVIKILVPIILIAVATFELVQAITATDEKKIGEVWPKIIKKFVAAIIVFFVPGILNVIFNLFTGFNNSNYQSEYKTCAACVFSPYGNDCREANNKRTQ